MKIKKTIEKVPGGMMLMPMLFSTTLNTFCPQVFQIGGFVTEIMTHHNTFIGAISVLSVNDGPFLTMIAVGAAGIATIPFMGLALGTRFDFKMLLTAGPMGIVLGIITAVVVGGLCILADRITGGTGVAGAVCSSTAGNAVGVPLAVAAVDPTLEAMAAAAAAQAPSE